MSMSPKDLVAAYHVERNAGGLSDRFAQINKALKKRITKKRILIDDLALWAANKPLIARNPAEG